MVDLDSIGLRLFDIGAVRFGKFVLASGRQSPIYVDLRLLVSAPELLHDVALGYSSIMDKLTYDLIAAIPYAGLPIGTAVSLARREPMIFPRKTAKSYGTGKQIEGKWEVGQKVIVVEDLVTSGGNALEGLVAMKAAGLVGEDIVVLIDREQGGRQAIEERGYRLHSVFTMSQLLNTLEDGERISAETRLSAIKELGL